MAKTIGAYKGLWNQPAPQADPKEAAGASNVPNAPAKPSQAPQSTISDNAPAKPLPAPQSTISDNAPAKPSPAPQSIPVPAKAAEAVPQQPIIQESPEQLAHRYRMLVLREHRFKLGRDLLDLGHRSPWAQAFSLFTSLGRSFRPWAHARIFALGCYLGVDMTPDVLKQLRHPLWLGRYRRSMCGLWRLLELMAQKTGQTVASRFMFRLFYLCPPLGVLIFEKQLQSLLRKAQGAGVPVAAGMVKATQGQ